MQTLAVIINGIQQILILLIIISVILSYFMDPYHPIRRTLDRIVEPMLAPIRRVVPLVGMIDLSPLRTNVWSSARTTVILYTSRYPGYTSRYPGERNAYA